MKTELRFGSMDLPDDWRDRSSYLFVAPPRRDLGVPMLGAHASRVEEGPAGSFAITTLTGADLDALLAEHETAVRSAVPEAVLQRRDDVAHATLGRVKVLDVEMTIGGAGLTQRHLLVALPGGREALLLTATASRDTAIKVFAAALAALQSFAPRET